MNRTDYMQARLRQLRQGGLFKSGFSAWLTRLELGEWPSGIRSVYAVAAGEMVRRLIAGRR